MLDDEAKQKVLDAAEQGAQLGALDQRFVKLVDLAMQLVGLELARNIRPQERAAICVPVQVDSGTKVNPGAILMLEDRVVVAWSEGVFRPKPHSVAYSLADVHDVCVLRRKVGKVSAQLDGICFTALADQIEIILYSEVSHGRVKFMLQGALNRSLTFHWDESGRPSIDD